MKTIYLWCFFIILLNQEDTIITDVPDVLKCYETDNSDCEKKIPEDQFNAMSVTEVKEKIKELLECTRNAPEKEVECGETIINKCGIVTIYFENGDNLTFSGCETDDKDNPSFLKLCEKWSGSKKLAYWEKMTQNKIRDHDCGKCEGDMCNSKFPPTKKPSKKPIVTSPSAPKKEEKSVNSVVFPNMALLMLLVLLIFSF